MDPPIFLERSPWKHLELLSTAAAADGTQSWPDPLMDARAIPDRRTFVHSSYNDLEVIAVV